MASHSDDKRNRPSWLASAVPSFKSNPWLSSPYIVSIPLSCGLVLGSSLIYTRYLRRIPSAQYITPRTLERRGKIRGYVTSVGDADNFRLYHTPGPWPLSRLWPVPTDKKLLRDRTIHIRLAGVDAPECAHFGKPAQPFSAEALAFLTNMVLHRHIKVELLSKDHYGRMVGQVSLRSPFWWPTRTYVSLEMLKAGLATVYTLGGAEYGRLGKDKLDKAEAKARRKRRGMWAQSAKAYQSPAEYKRQHSS